MKCVYCSCIKHLISLMPGHALSPFVIFEASAKKNGAILYLLCVIAKPDSKHGVGYPILNLIGLLSGREGLLMGHHLETNNLETNNLETKIIWRQK